MADRSEYRQAAGAVAERLRGIILFKDSDNVSGKKGQARARREIMAHVSKLIFGAAIAAVSIAPPALAQYASQSDPSVSVHQRKHLRISSHQSSSPAFAPAPPVYDPGAASPQCASRIAPPSCPYHYEPGSHSGGQ
jgi:hypothetical protein